MWFVLNEANNTSTDEHNIVYYSKAARKAHIKLYKAQHKHKSNQIKSNDNMILNGCNARWPIIDRQFYNGVFKRLSDDHALFAGTANNIEKHCHLLHIAVNFILKMSWPIHVKM